MNTLGSYITSFTLAKFIRDITTPLTNTRAYGLGLIDARGNLQKEPSTQQEYNAWTPYDQMVISVRKLFDKIPDPSTKAKLSSFIAATKLFSEDFNNIGGDIEEFKNGVFNYMIEQEVLTKEDVSSLPTNNMSSGLVTGFGIGPKPPDNVKISPLKYRKKKKKNNFFDTDGIGIMSFRRK
jgi:hypothetical protein